MRMRQPPLHAGRFPIEEIPGDRHGDQGPLQRLPVFAVIRSGNRVVRESSALSR
jgi:hypothetical protein